MGDCIQNFQICLVNFSYVIRILVSLLFVKEDSCREKRGNGLVYLDVFLGC